VLYYYIAFHFGCHFSLPYFACHVRVRDPHGFTLWSCLLGALRLPDTF